MVAVTLRPAAPDHLDDVERLLASAGLPTDDVREKPDCFYVAVVDAEAVAVGGLERYGKDALLRSVAVEESARGEGIGTAVCDALAERARAAGVERCYLLTTTAADFFAARGYEQIDRADAPPAIRETDEFERLCPDDAVAMRRSL